MLPFICVQFKIIIAFLNDTVYILINFYEIKWSSSGYPVWRIKTVAYVQHDYLLLAYPLPNRVVLEILQEHTLLSYQLRAFFKLLAACFLPLIKEIIRKNRVHKAQLDSVPFLVKDTMLV